MSPGKVLSLIASFALLIVVLLCSTSIFETVDAGEIVVIQSPISGELSWYTTPGVRWQWFGKVTTYQKRSQLWFAQGAEGSGHPFGIRFNDAGKAEVSGSISWECPSDTEHLNLLHAKYGSHEAIADHLIETIIEKAIYMTGPMMSSTESYAGRRNELLTLIEDQIEHGVYQTRTTQRHDKDPITGVDREVSIVELVTSAADGKPLRAEESPLEEFGIKTFNLAITDIKYEERVEEQIRQQQQSTMAVQIAIAEAKRAEQQLLTTKKEGEASAAKAEWEQKTIAAKAEQEALMAKNIATTKAEQELAVAELGTKAAEQKKLADIALGEGESTRRKLVMEADGALEKKLEALVQINAQYATAIGQHQGAWVPSIVMGGGSGNPEVATSPTQLIELLTAKTARDLSLDLQLPVSARATPAP